LKVLDAKKFSGVFSSAEEENGYFPSLEEFGQLELVTTGNNVLQTLYIAEVH